MKKITLILITLLAFVYANAQYTVPRGLPYHDTRWIENKGIAGASYLWDSLVMFRNMGDTQMKPLYPALGYIQNFGGDSTFWIWDKVRWKKLGGGGAANDRFAYPTEDEFGLLDRSMDMQDFNFYIDNSASFGIYQRPTPTGAYSGIDTRGTGDATSIRLIADNTTGHGVSLLVNTNSIEVIGSYYTNPDPTTYLPLSVNNVFADATGNITIPVGGSGTVTSFSAGNLSPLFTSSVATSTTTPALTFSLTNAAGGTVFGNNTGSSAAPAYTSVPVLGIAGTTKGTIGLAGNTSGVITIQPQAAAGTFNFNLPITAGTSGFVLTSAGGGSSAMTWTDPATFGAVTSVSNSDGTLTISPTTGAVVASLNLAHANTWSAKQTFATGTTSLAPINIPAGTLTTGGNISNGNVEFDGTHMYMTIGGAQVQLDNQLSSFALAAIGSSPNANGATYSSPTFNLQPASASFGGVITTTTQTMGNGAKTFTQAGNDGLVINGTWTATATAQRHLNFNPVITTRNTASDTTIGMLIKPNFITGGSSATGEIGAALVIDPIYTSSVGSFGQQIAIYHRGSIRPLVTNTYPLGASSDVYSNTWSTAVNTGSIDYSNVGAGTITFPNGQGTGISFFQHGHIVSGEANNGTANDSSQLHVFGDGHFVGGLKIDKFASSPTISSITNTGVAGATTYTYEIVAYDYNGTFISSATSSTTTGNATLNGANFNVITWSTVVGAYRYYIYRTAGGATQGIISVKGQNVSTLNDTGLTGDGGTAPTASINTTGSIKYDGYLLQSATITAGGTTGAQTINKGAGCVNFAATATSLVVTDNFVTTTSLVHAWVQTNDATLFSCQTVPAAGSFTIYANAAATAETKVCFEVINTY